jgi:hypothetical protein
MIIRNIDVIKTSFEHFFTHNEVKKCKLKIKKKCLVTNTCKQYRMKGKYFQCSFTMVLISGDLCELKQRKALGKVRR